MVTATEGSALGYNLHVDYAIHYSFGDVGECAPPCDPGSERNSAEALRPDQSQAIEQLEKLLRTLTEIGLQTEVRQGDETSLLIFVRASTKQLKRAVHRSR